jgi:hypothetical protein
MEWCQLDLAKMSNAGASDGLEHLIGTVGRSPQLVVTTFLEDETESASC